MIQPGWLPRRGRPSDLEVSPEISPFCPAVLSITHSSCLRPRQPLAQPVAALRMKIAGRLESQQFLRQFQRSLQLMRDMFLIFGQGLNPRNTVVLSELAPDGERLFVLALLAVQLRQE